MDEILEELREIERMIKDAYIEAALYFTVRSENEKLLDGARIKINSVMRKLESEVKK